MSSMGLTARRKRSGHGFGHTCECTDKRCRERIYIAEGLYQDVRNRGTILARSCAEREGRTKLGDYGWFVLCASSRATLLA